MPKSVRHLPKLGLAALAIVATAFVLVGCAPAVVAKPIRTTVQHVAVIHEFPTFPGIRVRTNVEYAYASGHPLRLDVCLPKSAKGSRITPRPAILVIHGGSWTIGSKDNRAWRSTCEWLASSGFVAAAVDYRLAPAHIYPAAIDDIQHAVEWLRAPAQAKRFSIDPALIGVFGGSAGGNLAALVGTEGEGPLDVGHRVAAVAELSGPANLTASGPERLEFVPAEAKYLGCKRLTICPAARQASPLYHVDPTDPPFFVGNSTDELIPLAQSQSLVAKLKSVGDSATLAIVPGRQHSVDMLDAKLRDRILAFFHDKLVHTLVGAVK
jgi:acetyl esterase